MKTYMVQRKNDVVEHPSNDEELAALLLNMALYPVFFH